MIIKILATSDLHGYIYPTNYSDNIERNMGLAKLASQIEKHRDKNTILIDNGDTIQGSPLTYYHHLYNEENINPMALCLNSLNYDFVNIGNHDFNYGKNVLNRYLNNLNATCITLNIKESKCFDFTSVIKNIGGVKLAFMGVTTDYIPNWENPRNIEDVRFLDVFETVKNEVELLRQQVDYIIVSYHGGFENDLQTGEDTSRGTYDNVGCRLCQGIDGIDILITGHQHRSISQMFMNTYVSQTAQNGQELAVVEIDTETRQIRGKLIDAEIEASTIITELIAKTEVATQKWLEEPIGYFKEGDCKVEDEINARVYKHPCVSLLNQVQMDYTKAEISASALFNGASGFNHEVKMRDIVSTYVYPNSLVKLEIQGKDILSYLNKAAEYFSLIDNKIVVNPAYMFPKPLHFEYDMVDGIAYTINVSKAVGHRVELVTINNEELDLDRVYTMAVNNYRYSGGGGYSSLKNGYVISNDGKEMVEILAEYIMNNSPVIIKHQNNIKIVK